MDFTIWLPILAMLLGAITHSLTDDGGASIIAHIWPGATWRLPQAAVPLMVLACGVAADTLQSYVAGTDWQHALATAVASAVATLFGAVAHHSLTTAKAANDNAVKPSEAVTPLPLPPPTPIDSKKGAA